MNKKIAGFECLYESHLKAQRGVIWKDSVAWYSLHGLEQTLKLSNELLTGTYEPKPPVKFTITKPKRRDIVAAAYRDRVYLRSINDNILYPKMTKSFIKENGACQIGKGVDYERAIFKKYLRAFYINYGLNGFVLQIDIKAYYKSMKHSVVEKMFENKLSAQDFKMVKDSLDSQYEGDTGYNPGSQMVQIAGISLLNGIDHFVKEILHVKYYVRYMDDMILFFTDLDTAEHSRWAIRRELNYLGLDFHEKKTRIYPISSTITFLGFDWRLTDTGKVVQLPRSQNIKDLRHTVNALMKLCEKGERTFQCVDDSFTTRISYLSKGDSYQLIERLYTWYEERIEYYGIHEVQSYPVGKG